MTVDPQAGKPRHEHGGHFQHFCSEGRRAKSAAEPERYVTATDPVCGMKVGRATARHMAKHEGERFYFCSVSPMLAAAAMSLSSVSVIGNALRLRRVRLDA